MRNYSTPDKCCCVSPERTEISVPPVEPAVDLDLVKLHLNISSVITQFDVLLAMYISVATTKVETFTCHTLITTTFEGYYNCFPPCILLKTTPNVDVTEILYVDIDDDNQVLASSEYNVFTDKFEAKVLPESSWPSTNNNTPDAVKVTFTAGYGTDTEDVPDGFQLAICQIVAYMFANKGDCTDDCVSAACLGMKGISCKQDLRALGGCN